MISPFLELESSRSTRQTELECAAANRAGGRALDRRPVGKFSE